MKERKERPIPFSGEMVKAILEGRKTQTRRVVTFRGKREYQKPPTSAHYEGFIDGLHQWYESRDGLIMRSACPYGASGDRLWVRETWKTSAVFDPFAPSTFDTASPVLWVADCSKRLNGPESWGKTRASRYMPRWASRITLEVVSVKAERLWEMTVSKMIAEGVSESPDYNKHPLEPFASLWDKINSGRGYGWDTNPWVWVIEFRRVQA